MLFRSTVLVPYLQHLGEIGEPDETAVRDLFVEGRRIVDDGRLTSLDTRALAEHLAREHGVDVVPGEFFGLPGHLRVGCGVPAATLEEGLARLSAGSVHPPSLHEGSAEAPVRLIDLLPTLLALLGLEDEAPDGLPGLDLKSDAPMVVIILANGFIGASFGMIIFTSEHCSIFRTKSAHRRPS